MKLVPDFDEFFGSLIAHRVEFLAIRAHAVAFHGIESGAPDGGWGMMKAAGATRPLRHPVTGAAFRSG